jgi:hypothetical protein
MMRQEYSDAKMFDRILREGLGTPGKALLNYFFPGLKLTTAPLPSKMRQYTKEQEADMVLKIEVENGDAFIFHLEFQKNNDQSMARRMASYDFMLHLKYNMNIVGIVIYIGSEMLKMFDTVIFNNNFYRCGIINIKDIDAELFLQSDQTRQVILAILGSYDKDNSRIIVRKILTRLQELLPQSPAEFNDLVTELEIIADVREEFIQQQILEELEMLTFYYDSEALARRRKSVRKITLDEVAVRVNMAEDFLKSGVDIMIVCRCTGVPEPFLRKLLDNLNNPESA